MYRTDIHRRCRSLVQAKLGRRGMVKPQDMRVIREVLVPRSVIHLDEREECISLQEFEREMGNILHEIGYEDFAWEVDAPQVLRKAAEDHMVEIFEKSCGIVLSRRKCDW